MKFLIGALVALLALKFFRRARHFRRHGCSRRGRFRGGERGSRARWIDHISSKLSLSGDQEEVVREQVKLFRARARSLNVPADTRRKVAAVLRSENFDENILGELFIEHDDAMRTMRLEAVERLAAVHDVLDPAQRELLAKLLERGLG